MLKELKYLTIQEQIDNLKSKGLIIENDKKAENYLCEIGYYKLINGYKKPFLIKIKSQNGEIAKKYLENTSIDDLFHLYQFDQEIKSLILKYISYIEVKTKARMSDVISKNFGIKESEYLIAANFKPDSKKKQKQKFSEIYEDIKKNITNQQRRHFAIKWYHQNYNYYPFWVLSNILTLGTISLLYSKLKQAEQNQISKIFGIKSKVFESSLMIMNLFRNACAHNEVVYCYKTIQSLSQKEIKWLYENYNIELNPKTGKYKNGINDILALIIIFKFLLPKSMFSEFLDKFNSALNKLKKDVNDQKFQEILLGMGIVIDLNNLKNLKIPK